MARLKIILISCLLGWSLAEAGVQVRQYSFINDGQIYGYWTLDESSGIYVSPIVKWRTGTLVNGGTWVQGKQGNGLLLAGGSSQWVNFGNCLNLDTYNFSCACWVKFTDDQRGTLVSKYGSKGFYLARYTDKKIFIKIRDASTNVSVWGGTVEAGVWTHIVVTADRSNPTTGAKIYINTQLSGEGQLGTGSISDTAPLKFGEVASSSYLYGIIDEVLLIRRILTPAEIQELYDYKKERITME